MPKTNYTLQDWYLERTDSKIASGQCESCNLDFKPEEIKWSALTQNFSCKSCIKEAEEMKESKVKRVNNKLKK